MSKIETLTRSATFRQDQIPLELWRVRHRPDFPMHRHEFSELVMVLGGAGVHVTPVTEYSISAGDVFVLHGDQAHGYRDSKSLESANILFQMDKLRLPPADVALLPGFHVLFTLEPRFRKRDRFESRLRLNQEELRRVADLVSRLALEFEQKPPGWGFAAIAYFMLIVAELCRSYAHARNPSIQRLQRLGSVIGHLEHHCATPVTLEDLAQLGHMSRRTLSRVFKDAMGCTPIEYLIQLRINRAMELLRTDDANITEVAFQTGFRDSNYFSRLFRKQTGHTPREFRKLLRP